MASWLTWIIVTLGVVNLVRMMFYMVGADIYDLRRARAERRHKSRPGRRKQPWVTVVIPAYNEELVIERCLAAVFASTYALLQVVVVDDGSTDGTKRIVKNFQKRNPLYDLTYVQQRNSGKAAAINNAIKNHSESAQLIMVLDADSVLEPQAVQNSVRHFDNKEIIAMCANVRIIPDDSILGLIQQFEYVISYRMKRALTSFNMEYIVGGVASTFRKSVMEEAGLYDTDTITEDIDFTMKLIGGGNRKDQRKVAYASDVIVHTEHVGSLYSLIRQRFRWKYGRIQTFLKHRRMFFNLDKKYDKRLTWINLPMAVFGDLALLIEPAMIGFIFYLSIISGDSLTLISAYAVISAYIIMNVLAESTMPLKERHKLAAVAPALYLPMLLLTLVEFIALMLSIFQFHNIIRKNSNRHRGSWQHVERVGNNKAALTTGA